MGSRAMRTACGNGAAAGPWGAGSAGPDGIALSGSAAGGNSSRSCGAFKSSVPSNNSCTATQNSVAGWTPRRPSPATRPRRPRAASVAAAGTAAAGAAAGGAWGGEAAVATVRRMSCTCAPLLLACARGGAAAACDGPARCCGRCAAGLGNGPAGASTAALRAVAPGGSEAEATRPDAAPGSALLAAGALPLRCSAAAAAAACRADAVAPTPARQAAARHGPASPALSPLPNLSPSRPARPAPPNESSLVLGVAPLDVPAEHVAADAGAGNCGGGGAAPGAACPAGAGGGGSCSGSVGAYRDEGGSSASCSPPGSGGGMLVCTPMDSRPRPGPGPHSAPAAAQAARVRAAQAACGHLPALYTARRRRMPGGVACSSCACSAPGCAAVQAESTRMRASPAMWPSPASASDSAGSSMKGEGGPAGRPPKCGWPP